MLGWDFPEMVFSVKEKLDLTADPVLCVRCGSCEAVCPSRVFYWKNDAIEISAPGRCIGCGHCVAACPHAAFRHSELKMESFSPTSGIPAGDADTIERILRERRTVRRFKPDAVTIAEIEDLLDAARYAPTSTNSQNVRFVVLSGEEKVSTFAGQVARYYLKLERQLENPLVRLGIQIAVGSKLVNAYRTRMPAIAEMFRQTLAGDDRLFYGAPAVAVLFASGMPHLAAANCGLAAAQILLAAEPKGLGACFNGYALTALIRDRSVCEKVGISREYTPGAVIAIGRPAGRFYRVPPRQARRVIWF
jgi:nitroreductase/NAD-dependent dihydropyrimidine dehydrogenase PreA subunit